MVVKRLFDWPNQFDDDEAAMAFALVLAKQAEAVNEVPVGAVVVDAKGKLIGAAYNQTISKNDPTAHAEILALRDAAKTLANYRLPQATLFVTLEPCAMCVGALLHARLKRVVYAASDPKTGACHSVLNLPDFRQLNHQTVFEGGVAAAEAAVLLRQFFRQRRNKATK